MRKLKGRWLYCWRCLYHYSFTANRVCGWRAESPPMDTAASIDETVPDEPPISPEDNSGTVEASPPPLPEPSAEPDADENPDGTEDSTASEPDAAPTPDVSATQMPTPIPTPNPINLEYEYLPESETGGLFVFPAPYGDDLTQEYSAEHPAWGYCRRYWLSGCCCEWWRSDSGSDMGWLRRWNRLYELWQHGSN